MYVCTSHRLLASGSNRLLVAASTDDTATISRLVREEGVTVDAEFFHNGYTALHRVSEEGYLQSAELLITLGADVNKRVCLLLVKSCDRSCDLYTGRTISIHSITFVKFE